jgi:4-amino-4-deoxy-L-arabinose transferase-like glycosyltransferase
MAQPQEIASARAPGMRVLVAQLESSIQSRPTIWAFALLAAGLVVRVWHASGTYLNPDEALHFFMANKTSWWLTYKASLSLLHPPLLILLLHAWRSLGTSEFVLRLPSILAGTAFCWLAYRWLSMLFDKSVALIAFVFLLFLPSSIDISTEVRQYALVLAFAMASAYLLEKALANNSVQAMLFSGVCLWVAIGSHYSAFLFAVVLGIYAIWRMLKQRPPLKVFAAWEAGQVVALGLCYFLYVTQIATLGQTYGGATHGWMSTAYLGNSYFTPGKINPLLFIFARTGGVFQYEFGQAVIGDLAYLLFVIGIVMVFRNQALGRIGSRQLGILLLLPFILNCAAALAQAYPYGGTRHSAVLLPFAVAGVSVSLAHFLRNRLAWGVITALLISLFCNVFSAHRAPYMSRTDQSSANMKAALIFINQQIPAEEPIFADYQSSLLLGHYLCGQKPVTINHVVAGFLTYECGGHRLIATDWNTYLFNGRSFYDQWQSMVSKYHLSPGSKVWVTQMGWSTQLAQQIGSFPAFHLAPHFFGGRIQIFDLTVGQSMPDPELLPTS